MFTRSLKTWFVVILIAVIFTFSMKATYAIVDPIFFWIVGQVISDQKQDTMNRYQVGLNPTYNVFDPGHRFVGACPDAKQIVSSIGKGATIEFNPGECGRVEIVGAEINSNEENFVRVAKLRESLKGFKEVSKDANITYISENAPGKFILPVSTVGLDQRLYTIRLTTWFVEQEACGLFKTGRRDVVKREETIIRIIILDPDYMARAIADPQIQSSLRSNYGLMAVPTMSQPAAQVAAPSSTSAPMSAITFAESQTASAREETVVTNTEPIKGEIAVYGQRGNPFTVTTIEQPSGLRNQANFTIKASPCRVRLIAEQSSTTRIAVELNANGSYQRDEISYNRYQVSFDITPGKKYLAIGGDPQRPRGIDPSQIPLGSQIVLADRDMKVRSKSGSGRWYDGWIRKGEPLVVQKYKTVREGEYLVDYFRVRTIVRCGNDLKPIEYGVKVPMSQNKIITQQIVRTEIHEVAYMVPHDNFDKNFTREISKPDQGSVSRETPAGLWTPSLYYSDNEFNTNVYGSSATGGNATGGAGGNAAASSAAAASASAAAGAASN